MALHCNESSTEKSMNVAVEESFVKENHILSRERVTASTQLSTEKGVPFKPEFIFQGKGKISSHSLLKASTPNQVRKVAAA